MLSELNGLFHIVLCIKPYVNRLPNFCSIINRCSYPSYINVTEKEFREAFLQICGDIFGYVAGGVGLGWNLCSLGLTTNSR